MNWFESLCRNLGLTIHHIAHPEPKPQVTKKTVEEKKISENVTLRRTTIEEIEFSAGPKGPGSDDRKA